MQVTNSATIVDYFPEAFIAEADELKGMKVVVKRFIRRVTFRANGMKSYSTVLGIEAKYDWHSRIANGSEVTGFNLDKMPREEYSPMACWVEFMSLIKSYLHTLQMNNQLEMLSQREQLIEDIDAIITSQYLNDKIDEDDMEDLIRVLCDAVCKNFPTN